MSEIREMPNRSGYNDLWLWFGPSYASWLTIPRVLMHEMPDEWQGKMAALLNEYEEAFPNQPDLGTRVQCTRGGRLTRTPDWMLSYRHPQRNEINKLRSAAAKTSRAPQDNATGINPLEP